MTHRRLRRLIACLLPWCLLGLGGCATGGANGEASAQPASAARKDVGFDTEARVFRAQLLRLGMHKPQVLDWLGEPKESDPATNANGMRETWVYEVIHAPAYKTVVAEMTEVPYVDPFTGIMRMIEEPVINQQRIQRFETITLTFRGPRVIDIERQVEDRSEFRN